MRTAEEKYPQHTKLHTIKDQSQACGDLLEWLKTEKGIVFSRAHQHSENCESTDGFRDCGLRKGELEMVCFDTTTLLAEFFGIDQKKLEDEKQAMLRRLRESVTK